MGGVFFLVIFIGLAGMLLVPMFSMLAEVNSDTYEPCDGGECEADIDSQQAGVTEVERNIFEIEQIDKNAVVMAVGFEDWEHTYAWIEIKAETESGTEIVNDTFSIDMDGENANTGEYELSDSEAELITHFEVRVVGGSESQLHSPTWGDE